MCLNGINYTKRVLFTNCWILDVFPRPLHLEIMTAQHHASGAGLYHLISVIKASNHGLDMLFTLKLDGKVCNAT